jgi:5-methylcytosine-specific restriction endonuclease McrA
MTTRASLSSKTGASDSDRLKRRLGRIAAGFNAKARRLNRRGVVLWTHLAVLPDECAYCGIGLSKMEGSYDHAVPWNRGGSNDPSNIVRCCLDCQRRKFDKTPEEFAEHKAMRKVCALPGCTNTFQPRYAEDKRGMARYCSRSHAAKSRWV